MKTSKLLCLLLVPFTLLSVALDEMSPIPPNTILLVCVNFTMLLCIQRVYTADYKIEYRPTYGSFNVLNFYLIWAYLNLFRGLFKAEFYWDYKNLLLNGFCSILPVFFFVFYNPKYVSVCLRFWLQWLFPLFFLLAPFINIEIYYQYLSPLVLLGLFIPILPRKWKIVVFLCLAGMVILVFSARSQMVKSLGCLLLSLLYVYDRHVSKGLAKFIHAVFFALPPLFLVLALSGTFNVLAMEEYLGRVEVTNSQGETESFTGDDRSHLYAEVIVSAINNNYVLWGRTAARGNDSVIYGDMDEEVYKTTKRYERAKNEACHLNIFTWEGLIGLILYSLIYLIASTWAVYHSRNTIMKMIGVYVAFRWLYGWVEDFNNFDLANMILWMMISMCYSPFFRNMTNLDIKKWANECLPRYRNATFKL